MIIKNADTKEAAIASLESLLAAADEKTKKLIADELRMLRAGIKGEQESAYHIDFNFKKSEITAVIHDLRIRFEGRVAQIDHLLIHRTHRFYVLETKNFAHGLKINEHGEFLRWNDWKKNYEGMPSPIEQNRRHVAVLREVLERLGYKEPAIESYILVSPNARIERPKGKGFPEVVKADQFLTAFEKNLSSAVGSVGGFLGAVSKLAFGDPPDVIAKKLVRLHWPITVDYAAKFGMAEGSPAQTPARTSVSQPSPRQPSATHFGNTPPASQPPSINDSVHACKSCASYDLSMEYGKYGYYFKCGSCGDNSSIKIGCGMTGHKERIRKDKLTFYRECEQCGSSSVFFTNKG